MMTLDTMRTWAEISLDNLEHNYRALRACAPDSRFLGVVKANAYGHGTGEIGKKLQQLGCDILAVACLDEAVELRLQDGAVHHVLERWLARERELPGAGLCHGA